MRKYRQIKYQELVKIETYLKLGFTQADIAIELQRNESTISRIISANIDENGNFNAEQAWNNICERKSKANSHFKVVSASLLEKFILEKIETYWSPEQIAGRWQIDTGETICHETIYQYMYKHHPEMVKLYFRRKGKKYRKDREKLKYGIDGMCMIDERPDEVEERKELGHWEGDTMIGKNHKQAISTNVERKSGYLLAEKMTTKEASLMADIQEDMFKEIPEIFRISLTVDQGKEFAWHKVIEYKTKMTVYFCHKASPWEKASNENTNGLLRQFIPKGTDFNTVTPEDLQKYVDLINDRPRKRLGYQTPREVFYEEINTHSCASR